MALDSMRCFGFKFNHLYKPDDGKVHLLLINSPGANTFVNKVKIFFPMFRAFFIGFRKEVISKNLIFKGVENVNIKLEHPEVFNVDGEALKVVNEVDINVKKPQNGIYIGNFENIKKDK